MGAANGVANWLECAFKPFYFFDLPLQDRNWTSRVYVDPVAE
jgi:hypothetical protein